MNLRGVWRPEDQVLQFLAFPDIKVGAEKRAAIYEALGLINEQLWLGHFEMWSGVGLIVFRHVDHPRCARRRRPAFEQAEAIAEAAVEECERFYPVFQFVLWGGKSPSEAIAAALIDTARRSVTRAHRIPDPTWFVGCGNMGGAMVDGWRAAGVDLSARDRHPAERDAGRRASARSPAYARAGHAPRWSCWRVKPQKLDEVAPDTCGRAGRARR